MTANNKKELLDTIAALRTISSTNLWDGLKVGMNLLHESAPASVSPSNRLSTLFILTDGMPNVEPPRGHIPMLKSYLDSHSDSTSKFSINTFGFGYDLNSQLLHQIAQVGGGSYAFIPDSGMVGTVFVHAVANAYGTWATRVRVNVEYEGEGLDEVEVMGGIPGTRTSWGIQLDAGDVQFAQTRDYVLCFPIGKWPKLISASATLNTYTNASSPIRTNTAQVELSDGTIDEEGLKAIAYHSARLSFVTALFSAAGSESSTKLDVTRAQLTAILSDITSNTLLSAYGPAQALSQDISGQGLLALEGNHFKRWGRHYFPSLGCAHQKQQCVNFKDPGLQVYGAMNMVFKEERDQLDTAFDELPPPKPSLGSSKWGQRRAVAVPKSMASWRSISGPCFSEDSIITLSDGTHIRLDHLKRGMMVQSMTGARTVAAVTRTTIEGGEAMLCFVTDGLAVTPWHPLYLGRKWIFPADVAQPKLCPCSAVYSVLLFPDDDINSHTISVGGIWAVTLGHGLTTPSSNDIRAHGYLGSYSRVLDDLSKLPGFDGDGVVRIVATRRDREGKICGFVGERSIVLAKDGYIRPCAIGVSA